MRSSHASRSFIPSTIWSAGTFEFWFASTRSVFDGVLLFSPIRKYPVSSLLHNNQRVRDNFRYPSSFILRQNRHRFRPFVLSWVSDGFYVFNISSRYPQRLRRVMAHLRVRVDFANFTFWALWRFTRNRFLASSRFRVKYVHLVVIYVYDWTPNRSVVIYRQLHRWRPSFSL